jgi:glycosyltransferase involved in cell wall biosynthesis
MKKRLCILLPSHWAAKAGGAELQVKMLLERLEHRDLFDVHYVARNVSPSYVAHNYTIHHVRGYRPVVGSFFLDAPELLRLLGRLRPNVIYQRVACAYTGVAAYFAKRHGTRMVWHVSSDRDLMPLPPKFSWRSPIERMNKSMIEYGARTANSVIVQSQNQAALLQDAFDRADAITISNSHSVISALTEKTHDEYTVCWIGNIKAIKKPDVFLQLAEDFCRRDDVRFIMIGAPQMDDSSWHRIRSRINSMRNVVYQGSMPHSAVGEFLARAHILVNTSPVEGFPNTFIEAWMREVPVLSLSVNPDGVFDGNQNGICAGGSYDVLKSALVKLLENRALRQDIGRRSAAYAKQRFSERNLDSVIEVLNATSLHPHSSVDVR